MFVYIIFHKILIYKLYYFFRINNGNLFLNISHIIILISIEDDSNKLINGSYNHLIYSLNYFLIN